MLTEINNLLDIISNVDLQRKFFGISQQKANATFLIHYFLNSFLKNDRPVLFLGMSQTFSHYNSVAQKFGINLAQKRENGQVVFVEGMKHIGETVIDQNKRNQDGSIEEVDPFASLLLDKRLKDLYLYLKAKASTMTQTLNKDPALIIDDVTIFLDLGLSLQEMTVFTQYLHSEFVHNSGVSSPCEGSLILFLNRFHDDHEDDTVLLWNFINHTSSVCISVNGLESGHCKEIDGEICVKWHSMNRDMRKRKRMHFKLSDKNVAFFAPGMSSAVL